MCKSKSTLCVTAKLQQEIATFDVPTDVFSTVAEQLRFDALRAGLLAPEDWLKVTATVATRSLDDEPRSTAFGIKIALVGGPKPIARIYHPARIERLRIYVQRQLAKYAGFVDGELEIHWTGLQPSVEVPLAPLALPFQSLQRRYDDHENLAAPQLTVTQEVFEQLSTLAHDSLLRGTELGGCLIGRIQDLDNLVIDRVVRAPDTGGSSAQFSFEPRFWACLGRDCEDSGSRIVGFIHSHLIDRGHGETLSLRDLETAHLHFSMPWAIAGLICASERRSSVRWFRWQDGTMAELDEPIALFAPIGDTG